MRAGGRSCLIEVFRPGSSELTGEPNPPPIKVLDAWCSLIPVRGRESETGAERTAKTLYSARLDYLDGQVIDETMFVVYEGLTFAIEGVLRDLTTQKTVDLQLSEQKNGA